MVHDKKIIAACGETELANPKKTIITMMQVSGFRWRFVSV
jgi:chitin synthase